MEKYQYIPGTQATGAGLVSITNTTINEVNALDQHEKSLAALTAGIEDCCRRAGILADRMFGSIPQSVGAQGDKTPANPPTLRRLENLTQMAHDRLQALGEHVARLERL